MAQPWERWFQSLASAGAAISSAERIRVRISITSPHMGNVQRNSPGSVAWAGVGCWGWALAEGGAHPPLRIGLWLAQLGAFGFPHFAGYDGGVVIYCQFKLGIVQRAAIRHLYRAIYDIPQPLPNPVGIPFDVAKTSPLDHWKYATTSLGHSLSSTARISTSFLPDCFFI